MLLSTSSAQISRALWTPGWRATRIPSFFSSPCAGNISALALPKPWVAKLPAIARIKAQYLRQSRPPGP